MELFLAGSDIAHRIGCALQEGSGAKYNPEWQEVTRILISRLSFCEIDNIDALSQSLAENENTIISLGLANLGPPSRRPKSGSYIPATISLFYLCHLLVLSKNDPKLLKKYLTMHGHERVNAIATKLTKMFKEL